MSYLSATLGALMRQHDIRGSHLAKATGIDVATISRLLNDQQKSISDEDIIRICKALSDDPREQAQLIAARMRDVQTTDPAGKLISLKIEDVSAPYVLNESGTKPLTDPIEQALATIRKNLEDDEDLKQVILGLGNIYAEDPEPEKQIYPNPIRRKLS